MKIAVKHSLFYLGLFPFLDLLRRWPEIARWVHGGCCGTAPPPVKRMVLASYLRTYRLKQFIETGTHLGDTLACIAQDKSMIATSIELDEAYYYAAMQRFKYYRNVTLIQGDSGVVLPQLVRELQQPALFWLDGHYSGGSTAQGAKETPVSTELEAILASSIRNHVILIDDARCFDGTHDYPHLDQLLATVRDDDRYDIEISADIVRLTPKQ